MQDPERSALLELPRSGGHLILGDDPGGRRPVWEKSRRTNGLYATRRRQLDKPETPLATEMGTLIG